MCIYLGIICKQLLSAAMNSSRQRSPGIPQDQALPWVLFQCKRSLLKRGSRNGGVPACCTLSPYARVTACCVFYDRMVLLLANGLPTVGEGSIYYRKHLWPCLCCHCGIHPGDNLLWGPCCPGTASSGADWLCSHYVARVPNPLRGINILCFVQFKAAEIIGGLFLQ